jgi:hypothetical protein
MAFKQALHAWCKRLVDLALIMGVRRRGTCTPSSPWGKNKNSNKKIYRIIHTLKVFLITVKRPAKKASL